jgi:hypothetical protein
MRRWWFCESQTNEKGVLGCVIVMISRLMPHRSLGDLVLRNGGWASTVAEGTHEAVEMVMTTASTEAGVTVNEELGERLGVRAKGVRVPKTERGHAAERAGTVVVTVVMTMKVMMSTTAETTSPTTHAVPAKVRGEGEGRAVGVEREAAERKRSPTMMSVAVAVVPGRWRREGHFALGGRQLSTARLLIGHDLKVVLVVLVRVATTVATLARASATRLEIRWRVGAVVARAFAMAVLAVGTTHTVVCPRVERGHRSQSHGAKARRATMVTTASAAVTPVFVDGNRDLDPLEFRVRGRLFVVCRLVWLSGLLP